MLHIQFYSSRRSQQETKERDQITVAEPGQYAVQIITIIMMGRKNEKFTIRRRYDEITQVKNEFTRHLISLKRLNYAVPIEDVRTRLFVFGRVAERNLEDWANWLCRNSNGRRRRRLIGTITKIRGRIK
jgi:hypothetical protein